jgi:hypothetical protein
LGLEVILAGDSAMGVEKLVGDVGHDGGAAGRDAAFGDEDEEAGEKLVDVETGAELGELREEFGGEVFGVILRRLGRSEQSGMAETEMRASVQNSETAAAAIGGEVTAAGRVVQFGLGRVRGVALGNACGIGGAGFIGCEGHLLFLSGKEEGCTLRRGKKSAQGIDGKGVAECPLWREVRKELEIKEIDEVEETEEFAEATRRGQSGGFAVENSRLKLSWISYFVKYYFSSIIGKP